MWDLAGERWPDVTSSHALCGMGLRRDAATRPAHGGANPAPEGGVTVHGATGTQCTSGELSYAAPQALYRQSHHTNRESALSTEK